MQTRLRQILKDREFDATDLGDIKNWDVLLVKKSDGDGNLVVEAIWIPKNSTVDQLEPNTKYRLIKGYDLNTLVNHLTLKIFHVYDKTLKPEAETAPVAATTPKKSVPAAPKPVSKPTPQNPLEALSWEAIAPESVPEPVLFEGTAEAFRNQCTVQYCKIADGPLREMLLKCGNGMTHYWGPESVEWINEFPLAERTTAYATVRTQYLDFLNQKHSQGETARPRHGALEQQTLKMTCAIELIIIKTAIDNQEWEFLAFFIQSLIHACDSPEGHVIDKNKNAENTIVEHLQKILCLAMGLQPSNCGEHSVADVKQFLFKLVATSTRQLIPIVSQNYAHLGIEERIAFMKRIVIPSNFPDDLWELIEGEDKAYDTLYHLQNTALFLACLKGKPDAILGFAKTFIAEGLPSSDTKKVESFTKSKFYRAKMKPDTLARVAAQGKAKVVTP